MSARDRTIAGSLLAAMAGAVLFVATYATSASRLFEGLAVALCGAGFCAAATGWAFWILPDERVVDERDDYPSATRERGAENVEAARSLHDVTRRRALNRLLYAALGFLGIALVVPLRSLGPAMGGEPFHTKWRKGSRMQREDGSFVRAADVNVDSVATVFPEGAVGDAQSQVVLVRLPDGLADADDGYIAYSKVCTHAGCPVALYRSSARQLMCPCHQSVFDVVRDGRVVSGPADHALPRLPLRVGADGFIVADGDFPGPVGPGFWEQA